MSLWTITYLYQGHYIISHTYTSLSRSRIIHLTTGTMPVSGSSKDGYRTHRAGRGGKRVVEYHWYCCYCQYGPFNVEVFAACTHCHNHIKGSCCRVEKVVR